MKKMINDNIQKGKKHSINFKQTFGLSMIDYMCPITGFNICKFDDYIKTPNGISTKMFIEEKYGKNAVKLIESLI